MESKIDENLMKIRSGAGRGHLGSDFGVSEHLPAPMLGEKVMQNYEKCLKVCGKALLRSLGTAGFFTSCHGWERVPAQLGGNAFRENRFACKKLIKQCFFSRNTIPPNCAGTRSHQLVKKLAVTRLL